MDTRYKFAIIPALALICVITGLIYALDQYVSEQVRHHLLEDLTHSAQIASSAIAVYGINHNIDEMDALADELGRAANKRITIIMYDGMVLGDSERSVAQVQAMENHLGRPEVEDALNKGLGVSRHYSATLGKEMLYAAVRQQVGVGLAENQHPGEMAHAASARHFHVVRAAIDMDTVTEHLDRIQLAFVIVAIVGIVTVLGVGLTQSRFMSRQLSEATSELEQEVQKRTQDIVMLQRLGASLNASGSMEEAGEVIKLIVQRMFPDTRGGLYITKASRNLEDLLVNWGDGWDGPEQFAPSQCWAMRKGRRHLSNEDELRMLCDHLEGLSFSQSLCIPLIAQGESLGSFTILTDEADWRAGDINMAQTLAEQMSIILASLQLREDLRQQAIRDPLTGLFNRRYMLESLYQVIGRAERQKSTACVLMIDIDDFKRLNDTYGHDFGDIVLKHVASEMKQCTRQEDVLCRYGGEEFCLVCPDLDQDDLQELGERLCDHVRRLSLEVKGASVSSFSISAGMAVFPRHGRNGDDLLQAADKALYQAKSRGKDQAVLVSA